MAKPITTPDLETSEGVTRFQLKRWSEAGLIPPPLVQPGPKGRGRQGLWHQGTRRAVRRIKGLAAKGLTIAEIAAEFAADVNNSGAQRRERATEQASQVLAEWQAATALTVKGVTPKQGKKFPKGSTPLLVLYELLIASHLKDLGFSRSKQREYSSMASRPEEVLSALKILFGGQGPVLQIARGKTLVMPDFAVSWTHSSFLMGWARDAESAAAPVFDHPARITIRLTVPLRLVWSAWTAPSVEFPATAYFPPLCVDEMDPARGLITRYPVSLGQTRDGGLLVEIRNTEAHLVRPSRRRLKDAFGRESSPKEKEQR